MSAIVRVNVTYAHGYQAASVIDYVLEVDDEDVPGVIRSAVEYAEKHGPTKAHMLSIHQRKERD